MNESDSPNLLHSTLAPTSLVDKVARAMFDIGRMASVAKWETFWATPALHDNLVRQARAAIEAMRNPTDEMYEGVNRLNKMWRHSNSREIFQAMIDGALHDRAPDQRKEMG